MVSQQLIAWQKRDIYLYVCHFQSLPLFVTFYLFLCLCHFLCLCQFLFLSIYSSLPISTFLCVSFLSLTLYLSLSFWFCMYFLVAFDGRMQFSFLCSCYVTPSLSKKVENYICPTNVKILKIIFWTYFMPPIWQSSAFLFGTNIVIIGPTITF